MACSFKDRVFCPSVFFLILLLNQQALAAPPFITDDPVPVDFKHYDFFLFAALDKTNNPQEQPQLYAPSVEINYGLIPNLQFHLILPYVWSLPPMDFPSSGFGDAEVGFLYRFIEESNNRPQVGFYPIAILPSGNAKQGLGNGKIWMKWPLWLQKSIGTWTSYGGGGYAINSQEFSRNFAFGGWTVQKKLGEKLMLGSELYFQGATNIDSKAVTVINFGGSYKVSKSFAYTFSVGHSVLGEQHSIGFVSLNWAGG